MDEDLEHKALKRKIYRRMAVVIVLVVAVIINTLGLLIGAVFYDEFCVLNTRVGLERFKGLQRQLDQGIKTKHWQDVELQSRYGYILKGTYLPNPRASDKTVIFVHGITASRLMGLYYTDIYFNAGYNVLIYDMRAHGESGGPSTTWGFYEKYDLDQWVDWVEKQHPGGIIGVHGVSMGAATALLHAELNETSRRVKFYVADSAYADLENLLMQQIDDKVSVHDPMLVKALFRYSSAVAYLKAGFYYGEVSPVQAVAKVTTPILFLHGEADRLVPVENGRQLYGAAQGYKELHTFAGTGHAMAIFNNRSAYSRIVSDFITAAVSRQGGTD